MKSREDLQRQTKSRLPQSAYNAVQFSKMPMTIQPSHPPGHFYSPIINSEQLAQREDIIWDNGAEILGIDFNEASHNTLLVQIKTHLARYDYPEILNEDKVLNKFYSQNTQFCGMDARALFVFLQLWKPKRMIEVGSGFSSLLTADVNTRFLHNSLDFKCIEPYPREFLRTEIRGIKEVIVERVETVPVEFFQDLDDNDILFIDSSHVSKTGSDVNYLLFEVLPRLKTGVKIHFHDIFLPREYPKEWVLHEQRSWNEQYLVRALLMYSSVFKIVFSCAYAFYAFPELVKEAFTLPNGQAFDGGSLWLEKTN